MATATVTPFIKSNKQRQVLAFSRRQEIRLLCDARSTDTGTHNMNPLIKIIDGITGEEEERPMTDEEYAELLASGWTPYKAPEPTEP